MSEAQREFNELMRDKERGTTHPEDQDDHDARSFLILSDDENTPPASALDRDDMPSRPSMSMSRSTIPNTRYGANTGPKGVISDAQNFRDSRRLHRRSVRNSAAYTSQTSVQQPPSPPSPSENIEELDDESDGEDDKAFMRKWRKSRLQQLQGGVRDSKMHSRERSTRVWGGLTTVNGSGYLDAVDNSPSETVVVVYIFDDYSQVSTSIEDCIRTLALKHLDVRFVKLHFEDAEMEPAGVPALLAYRGGEKFAGLVPVIQETPDDAELSASTLEMVLRRHQILR